MTKLSPAAQVMIAVTHVYQEHGGDPPARAITAAALLAVADQVVPPEQKTPWGSVIQAHAAELRIRNELLAIADELEAL